MATYMGDFPVNSTVPVRFDTYNSSGASVTLTGLAVTDVEIYKNSLMTQRSSDAGVSLVDTDGIDLDTITGVHGFDIDLSDNTDAGFYAAGSAYHVIVSAVTIDAQTVSLSFVFTIGVVESAISAALIAYDPPTKAELDTAQASIEADIAVTDGKVDIIDTNVDTLITELADLTSALVIASGTIGATGNTTTTLHLDGQLWGNDVINNYMIVIRDVSTGASYATWIEDWVLSTELATVATLEFTPQASTDLYWILPIRQDVTGGSGLDAAGVRAAVGLASANLDTQLAALPTAAEMVDEWETQSQADPTGFHVNVKEINSAAVAGIGTDGDKWREA